MKSRKRTMIIACVVILVGFVFLTWLGANRYSINCENPEAAVSTFLKGLKTGKDTLVNGCLDQSFFNRSYLPIMQENCPNEMANLFRSTGLDFGAAKKVETCIKKQQGDPRRGHEAFEKKIDAMKDFSNIEIVEKISQDNIARSGCAFINNPIPLLGPADTIHQSLSNNLADFAFLAITSAPDSTEKVDQDAWAFVLTMVGYSRQDRIFSKKIKDASFSVCIGVAKRGSAYNIVSIESPSNPSCRSTMTVPLTFTPFLKEIMEGGNRNELEKKYLNRYL